MKLSFSSISLLAAAAPTALASTPEQRQFPSVRDLVEAMAPSRSLDSSTPCYTFDEDETLENDLYCDCASFASPPSAVIEVVGPARLNLNGYTVKCSSGHTTVATIFASGKGARITNGYVYGSEPDGLFLFTNCIYLSGEGYHRVKNVVVSGCGNDCIFSEPGTHENKIVKNTVTNCTSSGIFAGGDGDVVKFNSAYKPKQFGVFAFGNDTRVQSNYVASVSNIGILVFLDGKDIFYNFVADCGIGIYLDEQATNADIRGNKISGSTTSGMFVEGDNSIIRHNALFQSDLSGIYVRATASGNELKKNLAYDNAAFDFLDEACGANTWYANKGNITESC